VILDDQDPEDFYPSLPTLWLYWNVPHGLAII
jgi:hypothetical protein